MRLKCLLSGYAFILFWGTIALFTPPSLLIYFAVYPFKKYPQDTFQSLASVIYKIFFALLPKVYVRFQLKPRLPKSAIYISTHQSSLDYPLLGYFIERYLTVTNLNFTKIPFASYVGRLIGARSLKKNNLNDIASMYDEFEAVLREERNVIIFPEGTRSDGTQLGAFKKGAFRLAMKSGRPLIPIIIDGSANVLAKGDPCYKTTDPVGITVTMLKPIYPDAFDNEVQLMRHVHRLMQYQNSTASESS